MYPISIIHHRPEHIPIQRAQIESHGHGQFLDTLLMQSKREMMMVDDVVPVLWTKNHRDDMLAEEPFAFLCAGLAPALALGLNFAHADRDLRWTQIGNGDRSHHRFADPIHLSSSTR